MQTIDLKRLDLQPQHTLLDLGCGEGRHALAAYLQADLAQVIAVDINARDVRTARQKLAQFTHGEPADNCHFLVADGLRLPFADHSFDRIICSEVLEHVPNYRHMLLEINRILKPGGTLAVSVPRSWPERICWWLSTAYHQVEGGHIRIFKARALRTEIEDIAYRLQERHWAHALHAPYWWLRCLFWRRGDQFGPVRAYHKLLVWDLMRKPWLTQTLERWLNPLMGKSIVMYFHKLND